MNEIWIFHGENAKFSSGVFTERHLAELWIRENKLSGLLTLYPVNVGVYQWSIANNLFQPKKEHELSSAFVQKFTSAAQEHYHYGNGELE